MHYELQDALQDELNDAVRTTVAQNKKNIIQSYHKYRSYFDKNANATPLLLHSYCLLFNPKITDQSAFAAKSVQLWLPLYRIEKTYTTSSYSIRK